MSIAQAHTQPQSADSRTQVVAVRFEHVWNTLGIGTAQPRVSWLVETQVNEWRQISYELETYDERGQLHGTTGRVDADESCLVGWPLAPLVSRQRLAVRVRVWGTAGDVSAWSELVVLEAGLLSPSDWSAQFIAPGWPEDTRTDQPCPFLRRAFVVRPGMVQARLYITALGVYEAEINGVRVGDEILAPGWTSYHHRLCYQTYDVTPLLHEGPNLLGAILGDGWYRGRLAWEHQRNVYGERLALLAQLELSYSDGTSERVISDNTWRATTGPILASSLYDGETYDAQRELAGWSTPEYDDSAWLSVEALERDRSTLSAQVGPPVRCTEVLAPVAVTTSPSGQTIVDFGQNLVGRVRFTVLGEAGQTVTVRHAEVLEDGELCLGPLRSAKATNSYTLRGGEPETWEPRFTFQGFRYISVEGWPGMLRAEQFVARVYHSDMARTGWFACSEPLLNQLHKNVVWSMRGNFLSIPTDCPQRDERLGWTGDIQVFAPTATFLYDCAGFLQSWLQDLALEQQTYRGVVPHVVPNVLGAPVAAAAWSDAAAVVPWVLYQRYGDCGLLEAQYASMCAWVDAVATLTGERHLWDEGFQYGDWLDPSAPPENASQARTSSAIVATAYFARSAALAGATAAVLGREEDAARYGALAAATRAAFVRAYVLPDGQMTSDAETAYALALAFNLLSDAQQRERAAARLQALVAASGYQIATGFVGTPLICDTLTEAGYLIDAYRLLLQRQCPSWLYPVTMGATTIWERWDSLRPDGTINSSGMTSFNHYALGAVADWIHRTVGGLAPAAPGYRQLLIAPRPGGGLTHADVRHHTPYGLAACAWRIADGMLEMTVTVPPNTSAQVLLPGRDGAPVNVGAGTHSWAYPYPSSPAARPAPEEQQTGSARSATNQ